MTEKFLLQTNTFLKNSSSAKCRISLNMSSGVLKGNIIDDPEIPQYSPPPPPIEECQIQLNFECIENSQYLPVI